MSLPFRERYQTLAYVRPDKTGSEDVQNVCSEAPGDSRADCHNSFELRKSLLNQKLDWIENATLIYRLIVNIK